MTLTAPGPKLMSPPAPPAPGLNLLDGETRLGEFQVQIARRTGSDWVATIPPLTATITNYRLILRPQTRRPYPLASIPSVYVTEVMELPLGRRMAVRVCLKTGHQLNLYAGYSPSGSLAETLRTMLTSPIGAPNFRAHLSRRSLERLIHFINRL